MSSNHNTLTEKRYRLDYLSKDIVFMCLPKKKGKKRACTAVFRSETIYQTIISDVALKKKPDHKVNENKSVLLSSRTKTTRFI